MHHASEVYKVQLELASHNQMERLIAMGRVLADAWQHCSAVLSIDEARLSCQAVNIFMCKLHS